jgi:arsenate reductase
MKTPPVKKTSILFLCTGNSCRSQMAEGWAKHLKNDEIAAYSAGIEKHGLNPLAVKAMAEAGVDISSHRSHLIEELPVRKFDYVITLCGDANETCPFFPGKIIHRGFEDPPKLAAGAGTEEEKLVHYRVVRDAIKNFIETLPQSLEEQE